MKRLCGRIVQRFETVKRSSELFCPAAYGPAARHVSFDGGFTKIIREPNSWNESPAFEAIRKFRARFLLVVGEKDQIIPGEVLSSYNEAAVNTSHKLFVTVPGAPHALHAWLEKNQFEKERVVKIVCDFLR